MLRVLNNPSFLPSCILAGVGIIFLVLVFTLPPTQALALTGGTAVAVGLIVARLRREWDESDKAAPIKVKS